MIKRSDYKKTLLDSVAIRIDYAGSIIDLPDTIKAIKPKLDTLGFKDMRKGRIGQGQINVNLKDPTQPPEVEFKSQDGDNYFFYLDNLYEIQVNDIYVMLIAKLKGQYISFNDYSHYISDILSAIRSSNGDYLKIIRIGLQKINLHINLDPSIRKSYFKPNVFPNSVLSDFDNSIVASNYLENYIHEGCNINYSRMFDTGLILDEGKERKAYRFIIDIDAYVSAQNDHDMIKRINDCSNFDKTFEDNLIILNNVIYDFFENSCTEKLLKILTDTSEGE